MNKFSALVVFLFFFCKLNAQVLSGEVVNEGRRLETQTEFKIESNFEGVMVYELSVDRHGEVASTRWIAEQSTLKVTPAKVEAVNYFKSFKFTGGTNFPQYQRVLVKVTFVKKETK